MINACSRTFKGHSGLNAGNVDRQALVVTGVATAKGEETVALTSTDNAPLVGAYSGNPGHEDNSVSVDVLGEFEIQMKAAVVAADMNKGVVNSDEVGKAKPTNTGGLGRIIRARTVGSKHYATILV